MMTRVMRYLQWLMVFGSAFVFTGCSSDAPDRTKFVIAGPIMGTSYRVTVVAAPDKIDKQGLQTGVLSALQAVDARMSTYKESSELSRFNNTQTTDWVNISKPLASVIDESMRVSDLSEGAFDVTVGPLVDLWGFGAAGRITQPPEDTAIASARARTGYRYLQLRATPPAIKKHKPDLRVDLSAVAKGYAVDQVCVFLETQGINDYLVDLGGDLRAKGINERGVPWTIAIEKPLPGARSIQRVVQVAGFAMATSGDYRNYFEKDGQRYSHTIDPRTGAPIRHRMASVTVVSEQAMHADALATALMVLGPEAGMGLAKKLDLAVFMIVKQGGGFAEQYTPKFRELVMVD